MYVADVWTWQGPAKRERKKSQLAINTRLISYDHSFFYWLSLRPQIEETYCHIYKTYGKIIF